jgi:large subunit ribosomal protein L29
MLKSNDLRERTVEDLRELEKTLAHDVFQNRFKNFTNRLDDTSSIRKAKKDLARVKTILNERAHGLTPVKGKGEGKAAEKAVAAEPTTTDDAPKAKAAKKSSAKAETKSAAKAEKPAAAEKPAKAKKTSKKSEG